MGWDAELFTNDAGGGPSTLIADWNYTHNTSDMIYAVLDQGDHVEAWYNELLAGKTGPEGAMHLRRILDGLEAEPARFRAMNPPNGWGNYDQLVGVLREMVDAVIDLGEIPSTWLASG